MPDSVIFDAITQRDLERLAALAKRKDSREAVNAKGEEPLPLCARLGWTEGVQALMAAGASPNQPDKDQSGFGKKTHPPLCEALAFGRADTAAALVAGGAATRGVDRSLLWGVCMMASRLGWKSALEASAPLEAAGFNPVSSEVASEWVFVGSCVSRGVKSPEDRAALDTWLAAQLGGAEKTPEQGDCAWSFLFSALRAGQELESVAFDFALSEDKSGRHPTTPSARALMVLEWGLEGANLAATRAACRAATRLGCESQTVKAFMQAAKSTPESPMPFSNQPPPESLRARALRQAECFTLAHETCRSLDGASNREDFLGLFASTAYSNGHPGLVRGALLAGVNPAFCWAWRKELGWSSTSSDRQADLELSELFCSVAFCESPGGKDARRFWEKLPYRTRLSAEEHLNQKAAQTESERLELALPAGARGLKQRL